MGGDDSQKLCPGGETHSSPGRSKINTVAQKIKMQLSASPGPSTAKLWDSVASGTPTARFSAS